MQSAVTSVRIIQFQWHFIRGKNTILIIEAKTFSEPCANLHNKSKSNKSSATKLSPALA